MGSREDGVTRRGEGESLRSEEKRGCIESCESGKGKYILVQHSIFLEERESKCVLKGKRRLPFEERERQSRSSCLRQRGETRLLGGVRTFLFSEREKRRKPRDLQEEESSRQKKDSYRRGR